MKKKLFLISAGALLAYISLNFLPLVSEKGDALPGKTVYASSRDIQVIVNGQPLQTEVKPQIIYERTYVPFRKLLEALGAAVTWDQEQRVATAVKDGLTVKIPLDSMTIYMQEHALTMDVPVVMIDDRNLVPLRFAAQALGAKVDWKQDSTGDKIDITQNYEVMIDRLVNGKNAEGAMKVNYEQAAILFEWLYKGQEKGELPEFTGSMPVKLPSGNGYYPLVELGDEYLKYWYRIVPNGDAVGKGIRDVFTSKYRIQEKGIFKKQNDVRISSYITVGDQSTNVWDVSRGTFLDGYYP